MKLPAVKFLVLLPLLLLVACAARQPAPDNRQAGCGASLSDEQELALTLAEQREKDGQLYAALAALQTLPDAVPEVMRHKADVLRRLGRPEAGDYFHRLQKTCLAAWGDHGLGLLAVAAGHDQEAETLLQKAAQQLPTEYRLRNDLGMLLLRERKMEAARFELMTALELSPDYGLPAVNMLTLLMVQQKTAAMDSLVQRYRMNAPDWQAAVQSCEELQRYWQRQGVATANADAACKVSAPAFTVPLAVRTGDAG